MLIIHRYHYCTLFSSTISNCLSDLWEVGEGDYSMDAFLFLSYHIIILPILYCIYIYICIQDIILYLISIYIKQTIHNMKLQGSLLLIILIPSNIVSIDLRTTRVSRLLLIAGIGVRVGRSGSSTSGIYGWSCNSVRVAVAVAARCIDYLMIRCAIAYRCGIAVVLDDCRPICV